ncbi:hypothetical protein V498_00445 [Pseudogymnoascus sp. VKM F-4517 (FW-2822)]|nr:hypothetical protein V498_00445 [Pseudogymnoascus sp. VKM F-4517 (FW-2822)]
MPVGIGGIGDMIALLKIVQGFAAALDGSRGAAAEYQEVKRELEGLEAALRCHQQLLQARRDDPALNAIFRLTQSTTEDCQRCIEAFSRQTVKFDRSLGVGKGGNVCKDVTMKVRWQLSKKDEVVRFRAELAQHISTLNMLFGLANINMQRITTDDINSKIDALEEKIDSNADAEAGSATKLRKHVEEGNNQLVVAVKGVQEELRLGWLGNCLSELKEMVSQIFITTGTTFSATQRIETILLSRAQKALVRTFTFEDALGRITQWDLVYISSWDALDAMIEVCFRDLPGHEKVARKEYVFQDERTNREIKRSTPWSGALLPDQHVNMGLLFRKQSSKNERLWCPYCHLELKQSQEGLIPCKCGMSHQRRTETVDINEEEDMPAFDLFDAPSSVPDDLHERPDEEEISMVLGQDEKAANSTKSQEDMSVFKRVIVVEVKLNIITRSTSWKPNYSESGTSVEDTSTLPQVYRTSYRGLSIKKSQPAPKATDADARMHHIPHGYSLKNWDPREEPVTLLGSVFDCNSLGKWIYDWTVYHHGPAASTTGMAKELWLLLIELSGKIKLAEECIPRIPEEDNRLLINDFLESGERLMVKLKKLLKLCESPMLKACRRITPKPKLYTFYQGSNSPVIRSVGRDQLGDKSQPSAQPETSSPLAATIPALQKDDCDSAYTFTVKSLEPKGGDTWGRDWGVSLRKQPKEALETKEGDTWGNWGKQPQAPKKSGLEFVDSIFGRDRYLDMTEKLMTSVRLWNLRFDANCEGILRSYANDEIVL